GDANFIVIEAKNTLDPGWSLGLPVKSIAGASRTELSGPGQLLFQYRCSACHSFGKGDQLGPDLMGVTARRDRAWLKRFIWAPDEMRANKDPIAVELASRYPVVMPNLSLTNQNLDDLLVYLEARSRVPVKTGAPKAETAPAAMDGAKEAAADDHQDHHN
ncbi:MAG TPA: cytochrome c, partial [Burkholderiales bacterium]